MKKLILSFVFVLATISISIANNNPTKSVKLVETSEVSVSVELDELSAFFKSASYDSDGEQLEYMTFEDITFVQIYNQAGDLEFQLPVQSTKVKIGKSLFGKGEYKVGFLIDGKSTIHFSTVNFTK